MENRENKEKEEKKIHKITLDHRNLVKKSLITQRKKIDRTPKCNEKKDSLPEYFIFVLFITVEKKDTIVNAIIQPVNDSAIHTFSQSPVLSYPTFK